MPYEYPFHLGDPGMLKFAAALLLPLALAGCVTTADKSLEQLNAEIAANNAKRLAALEQQYGKCVRGDRWRSVSVIGKTTSAELVRQIKACDRWGDADTSRYVSAGRESFFVHLGDRMWHFINGVLVSYRT